MQYYTSSHKHQDAVLYADTRVGNGYWKTHSCQTTPVRPAYTIDLSCCLSTHRSECAQYTAKHRNTLPWVIEIQENLWLWAIINQCTCRYLSLRQLLSKPGHPCTTFWQHLSRPQCAIPHPVFQPFTNFPRHMWMEPFLLYSPRSSVRFLPVTPPFT